MYSSVPFSSFTLYLVPELSHHPLPPYLPQPLAAIDLLSVSMDVPVLDVSHTWGHATHGLCVWRLSLSVMVLGYIHTSMWQGFIFHG